MTDSPSSSVPPPLTMTFEEALAYFDGRGPVLFTADSERTLTKREVLTAALASQEARHQQDKATLKRFHRGMMDAMERARPLCPDHRDKQQGECIVCRQEARHRQEMEEAKREHELLRRAVNSSVDDCTKACDSYGHRDGCKTHDPAAWIVSLEKRLEEAKRSRDEWMRFCGAAEQREREAGEAARARIALRVAVESGILLHNSYAGLRAWLETALNAHDAAIRSAPSPVSAPPTEKLEFPGKHIKRPECDATCLDCIDGGYEWSIAKQAYDEQLEQHVRDGSWEAPASPVEPGSDPQEPETR